MVTASNAASANGARARRPPRAAPRRPGPASRRRRACGREIAADHARAERASSMLDTAVPAARSRMRSRARVDRRYGSTGARTVEAAGQHGVGGVVVGGDASNIAATSGALVEPGPAGGGRHQELRPSVGRAWCDHAGDPTDRPSRDHGEGEQVADDVQRVERKPFAEQRRAEHDRQHRVDGRRWSGRPRRARRSGTRPG